MVDLLVLAADHAEARTFAEAGTSQPQNGHVTRRMAALHALLHDQSSDDADVTGRPEPVTQPEWRYHFGMHGGDFILMARRRAGLSQRELAERLGCRQATIARWERDERHPSFEETQAAVRACGFDLAGTIVAEDRSWWSQIALQLEKSPSERVRSLTPPGATDASPALHALAEHGLPVIVIGEVAGALQGWPLVLSGTGVVNVCGNPEVVGPALTDVGFADVDGRYALPTGQAVCVTRQPPGTHGLADLSRGADTLVVPGGTVQVAGVVDLLRIAEAASAGERTRDVLAYQAVLDVKRAQQPGRQVAALDDIHRSKRAANRPKDQAYFRSLPDETV